MIGAGVPKAIVPRVTTARTMLGLGDSNTLCSFLTHPTGGYRYYLKSFCEANNLWWTGGIAVSGNEWFVPCEGYSGWTCTQIAGITDAAMTKFNPDFVILLAGQNDLSVGSVADAGIAHLALVNKILTDKPTVKLIVNTIHKTTQINDADIVSLNAIIKANMATLVSQGKPVYICDLRAATEAVPEAEYLDTYLAADGAHLLWDGHALWASILQPIIQSIL